ncbi:MAG: hypothetical protein AAFP89_11805 [Bacteroidota bacterium]
MSISFLKYTLILLLGGLTLFLWSCEEPDDGSFTPQVIQEPEPPADTSFTVEDPCLTSSCALQSMTLDAGNADLTMEFYANYDVLREDAVWGTLKSAIIVVHGNNRNANEYFNWLTSTLLSLNKQNETILMAPQFKINSDLGGNQDLIYWSSNGWKRGFQSNNITSVKYSSYDIVDSMIQVLSDKSRFPNLSKIIVTGHSAGAQFTGLYAAASPMEDLVTGVDIEYIVANSQYFYYPGGERWNATSNQFEVPTGCADYTNWPYGFGNPTSYLSRFQQSDVSNRYVSRKVTFMLGTLDIFTNGTLNTSDCEAQLLGENRFIRGENMFRYIETFFPGVNGHQKVTVSNVGHDAAAMYNSGAALDLIGEILRE